MLIGDGAGSDSCNNATAHEPEPLVRSESNKTQQGNNIYHCVSIPYRDMRQEKRSFSSLSGGQRSNGYYETAFNTCNVTFGRHTHHTLGMVHDQHIAPNPSKAEKDQRRKRCGSTFEYFACWWY
uniref:Uncharacterized protein n=1 Tax=Anopheles merus TaxID=30066 RepID=A0A182UYE0_ANOME